MPVAGDHQSLLVSGRCNVLEPHRLLAQDPDIAPIPGTRRVARVEENTAADGLVLTADQLARLNTLTPAIGARHDEANMASIDR